MSWQPMETAPKDSQHGVVVWDEEERMFAVVWWFGNRWVNDDEYHAPRPVAWLPCEPPETK